MTTTSPMQRSESWRGRFAGGRNRLRRLRALVTVLLMALALAGCSEQAAPEAEPPGVQPITREAVLATQPVFLTLLDVRTPEEFAAGRIPNAINVPLAELPARIDDVAPRGTHPVVVYCESGRRARQAAELLVEAGYGNVRHLEGDMRGWREAGLLVVK